MAFLQKEDSHERSKENPCLAEGDHVTYLTPLKGEEDQYVPHILQKCDHDNVFFRLVPYL